MISLCYFTNCFGYAAFCCCFFTLFVVSKYKLIWLSQILLLPTFYFIKLVGSNRDVAHTYHPNTFKYDKMNGQFIFLTARHLFIYYLLNFLKDKWYRYRVKIYILTFVLNIRECPFASHECLPYSAIRFSIREWILFYECPLFQYVNIAMDLILSMLNMQS